MQYKYCTSTSTLPVLILVHGITLYILYTRVARYIVHYKYSTVIQYLYCSLWCNCTVVRVQYKYRTRSHTVYRHKCTFLLSLIYRYIQLVKLHITVNNLWLWKPFIGSHQLRKLTLTVIYNGIMIFVDFNGMYLTVFERSCFFSPHFSISLPKQVP